MILSTIPAVAGFGPTDALMIGPSSLDEVAPATTNPTENHESQLIEANLLAKLADGERVVIVQFEQTVPSKLLSTLGPDEFIYAFESIPALAVVAEAETVRSLAAREDVAFIEDAEKPLEQHLETATIASRAREVWEPDFEPHESIIQEPSPEVRDPEGDLIDGSGIGIAIVDSGIDATHPDLAEEGKVARNFVVTPTGVEEGGDYTEHGSTHGTKVAGIAAGTGAASSNVDRRGAAPGASLYGFATWLPESGSPTSGTVLQPAIAFDWILQNGAEEDPAIRVVTNAWTCDDPACAASEGQQAHLQLAEDLAEDDFVVVFSVGNEGGFGKANHVTTEAQLATRGILGVGNADDEELGARDDCTKSISSRGAAEDPTTWPDLIAPGDDVWSPQAIHPTQDSRVPVPDNPTPEDDKREYDSFTSTSASAGHMAGVAALVLQANPTLGSDEVEYILKATADKLPHGSEGYCVDYVNADPMHPWDGANFAAGHGIVDALDAVENATDFEGIPEMIEPEPVPIDLLPADPGLQPTHSFYLDSENGLTTDRPGTGAPLIRHLGPGDSIEHTSAPLASGFTTDGLTAEVWMGTMAEFQLSLNVLDVLVRVERLPADEAQPHLIFEDDYGSLHTNPANPVFRQEEAFFSDPVSFEQGDQIRMTIEVIGTHAVSPAFGNVLLYSDARPFPARLEFGEQVDRPAFGSEAWCIETTECTRLGGAHEYVSLRCSDAFEPIHVEFTGPAGSLATASCDKATVACVVPGVPGSGEVGTCRAQSVTNHSYTGRGTCTYTLPDGSAGGHGHCAEGALPGE